MATTKPNFFSAFSASLRCIFLSSVVGCAAPATKSAPSTDCPTLLQQSKAAGVDYVPTLRKAATGDEAALKSLFDLTGSKYFSTDAEQCHIEAIAELLNRLGDRQFSIALAAENAEIRRAVVSGLVIELDNLPTADRSRAAFADRYPFTAATVAPPPE